MNLRLKIVFANPNLKSASHDFIIDGQPIDVHVQNKDGSPLPLVRLITIEKIEDINPVPSDTVTVGMGLQALATYKELISYADHADCSVKEAYPQAWKLLQMFGIKQSEKDKDSL